MTLALHREAGWRKNVLRALNAVRRLALSSPGGPSVRLFSFIVSVAICGLATGCAMQQNNITTQPGVALSGVVHGGNQVVSGSTIQLYVAGTTGYASAAMPLINSITVKTDSNGNFNITGDYTCPSSTSQVYITATGGNPGLTTGTDNGALALMAALGNCGNLSANTTIVINEVSTVAAVMSMRQFMSGYANVGTSTTNALGLGNAITTVQKMVPTNMGQAQQLPNPGMNFPPPYIYPQATINSLANAIAACVNSDGSITPSTAQCAQLFTAATPPGGTAPSDTIAAALDIALHPANNVSTLFALGTPSAPFQPTLAVAPNDWNLTISYVTYMKFIKPTLYMMDPNGNFWQYEYYQNSYAYGFGATGTQTTMLPYFLSGGTTLTATGMLFDASGNLWLETLNNGIYVNGTNTYPNATGVTFDSAKNAYITSSSGVTVVPQGGSSFPITSGTPGSIPDELGGLWTVSSSGVSRSTLSGTSIATTTYSGAAFTAPLLLAETRSQAFWLAYSSSLVPLTTSGTSYSTGTAVMGGGLNLSSGGALAVDGDGDVWTANTASSNLSEFSAAGVAVSPSTGFEVYNSSNAAASLGSYAVYQPSGIGIDQSGDVWVIGPWNDQPSSTYYGYEYAVTDVIGAAAPTQGNIYAAAAANSIGTRP